MENKVKLNKLHKTLGYKDTQILKKYYKFIDDPEDVSRVSKEDPRRPDYEEYGKIIARSYTKKLYKQYALVDLTYYKLGR